MSLYEIRDATIRAFTPDASGRLQAAGGTAYEYSNYGNITKIGSNNLTYTRGNLLSEYDGNTYSYNYQGIRFRKESGGITTTYYLDGSKILGENRSNGKKLRYFYDANGLAGIRYNNANYNYLKDALGNITGITYQGRIICRYTYTAFGEYTVRDASGKESSTLDEIAYLNPFRWKSFYLDTETNWYYIDGRYYDPAICRYISVDTPENLLLNAAVVYGLNRYGLTVNNAIALVAALYSIFTVNELFADPAFVREKTWMQKVAEWFQNAMPLIRQIIVAIAFVVVAVVAYFAPYLLPALICVAAKAAISGFVIGGAIGGLVAAATGGNVWNGILEGAVYGAIDAAAIAIVIFGIVTAFKAAVAAVKAANAVRAAKSVEVASVDDLVKMMNQKEGLTAKFATGDELTYLRKMGAEGSYWNDGTKGYILLDKAKATRTTVFHEYMHHILQHKYGLSALGNNQDAVIEAFLSRYTNTLKL